MESHPSQIGPYRVDRELGRGGMGVVYLGHDQRLERPVAIKALPEAFAQEPERLARFEREARVLASLNHPNVGGIYGLEESDGAKYLILEFVEGDTLADRLAEGPLPLEDALEVARQIALGIEAAHEAGVVHRDLKPGNVKIAPDGQVKVLDFGLAKASDAETPSGPDLTESPTRTYGKTRDGIVLGTAGYMSPEQARGKRVDRRTDVWALGCILYEMLTGRQAFQGETISDTLAAVLRGEPDWALLPPGTPEAVRRMLHRCLEKDPRKRTRDAADAILDMDEALHGPHGLPPAAQASGALWPPRPATVWLAALAVACLIAGLLLGRLGADDGKGSDPPRPVMASIEIPSNLRLLSARIAPDGTAVVLQAAGRTAGAGSSPDGGKARPALYLRKLDSYEIGPIPGTEGARWVSYSQDGRWLAFVAPASRDSSSLRLMKVPVDGSAPPVALADWDEAWGDVAWLPGGGLLVTMKEGGRIVRVPTAGGGAPSEIKISNPVPGTVRYLSPRPMPLKGALLLSRIRYAPRGFQTDAVLLDMSTGKMRTLAEEAANAAYLPSGYLLFSRRDALLAVRFDLRTGAVKGGPVAVMGGLRTSGNWSSGGFEMSADGGVFGFAPGGRLGDQRRLAIAGPAGVEPWAAEGRAFNGQVTLSPDGKRVAAGITRPEGLDEIWVSDPDTRNLRRFVSDPRADMDYATWSPDGQRIAFLRSARDERDGLYWQRADRPDQPRLLMGSDGAKVQNMPCAWTPDGRSLIVFQRDLTDGKLRMVRAEVPEGGGPASPPIPFLESGIAGPMGSFSPDGSLFTFTSNASGTYQVSVAALGADGKLHGAVPVTEGTSFHGIWSHDGKSLAYLNESGHLFSVTLASRERLTFSKPVQVGDLEAFGAMDSSQGLDHWTDGRFLFVQRGEEEGEVPNLSVVLNFSQVIRAKLPDGGA